MTPSEGDACHAASELAAISPTEGLSVRPAAAPPPYGRDWLVLSGTRVVREALALNLRSARERAGFSQDTLAEYSGVDKRTISRIESAKGDTVLPKVYALALTLGIPVADLLAGLPEA